MALMSVKKRLRKKREEKKGSSTGSRSKNHGAALGGAMARGDGRPVVQVRKKSPRTTIVIRDRNDKRSGRSSIMTHMFAQSGWEIGHGHGRHLAGYNDENAKH